ncbi:hypothetical protein BGX27_005668 [Mortierella sp. AM989]|nr:hypothetical protein BGX27_005668 [Mortierella sp. AM989]
MKTPILLAPIFLASAVMAWGRETHSESVLPDGSVSPAKNRRYDYKQSMKNPFMYEDAIPFWSHHGNSFVAVDFIRLAPSIAGVHGSVWRSSANEYKEWEVEFSFKTHGQNYVGGKGMAFWYTQERAISGPVFGNKDKWKGLGIFLDSSDPANERLTPVIYGFQNDGYQTLPKNSADITFGGCIRDYKNTPNPVVVRVSYIGQTLKVAVDTFNRGAKMITCFEKKNVHLPTGYHFGFSKHMRPHEAEMIKKGQEVKVDEKDKQVFENVQKIVQREEQKMKEEQDGPEILSPAHIVAAVADTQFRIVESLNTIHKKLESLGAPMQPPESTAKSLVEVNDRLVKVAASLHAMEDVVEGMVDHILQQGGFKDSPNVSKVLKDELKTLKAKMEDMDTRQSDQHRVTHSRLISSTSWYIYVVFLIIVQGMAVSAYSWYKKKLEWSQKKFI